MGDDCAEFASQAVTFYCAKHDLSRTEGEAQFQQQLSVTLVQQVGQTVAADNPPRGGVDGWLRMRGESWGLFAVVFVYMFVFVFFVMCVVSKVIVVV